LQDYRRRALEKVLSVADVDALRIDMKAKVAGAAVKLE